MGCQDHRTLYILFRVDTGQDKQTGDVDYYYLLCITGLVLWITTAGYLGFTNTEPGGFMETDNRYNPQWKV